MKFAAKVYLMSDQTTVQVFQSTKEIDSPHDTPQLHFKTASLEDTHTIGRLASAALRGKLSES
jgi:hypothetical protein